jgi:1-acyl-sn-glycerol-3-phosphate acyltransferase
VLVKAVDRLWRLVGTAFAFAVIFGGGALAAATIFPAIGLLSLEPGARCLRTRGLIHRIFRSYITLLVWLRIMDLEVTGSEVLSAIKGHLIVANHPTLLDVVLLIALTPRVQCIVKHQLWSSRYLGGVVRQAGYIRNDQDAETLLSACREALAEGSNLIIFPEGTRTIPSTRVRFQRGFANIALLTGAEIQPVYIHCAPIFLTKGEPWWRIPSHRPKFSLKVGPSMVAREAGADIVRPLAARAVVTRLEEYYAGMLLNG